MWPGQSPRSTARRRSRWPALLPKPCPHDAHTQGHRPRRTAVTREAAGVPCARRPAPAAPPWTDTAMQAIDASPRSTVPSAHPGLTRPRCPGPAAAQPPALAALRPVQVPPKSAVSVPASRESPLIPRAAWTSPSRLRLASDAPRLPQTVPGRHFKGAASISTRPPSSKGNTGGSPFLGPGNPGFWEGVRAPPLHIP